MFKRIHKARTFIFTDLGKNAEIEYLLEDSLGGKFSIGRIDGVLRSVKSLDREEQGVYKLSVTAIDNGSPRYIPILCINKREQFLRISNIRSIYILHENRNVKLRFFS